MENPHPATELALVLSDYAHTHAVDASHRCNGKLAMDATRICAIAAQVRKLGEASCNAELTSRQAKRMESLEARADALLAPYGLKMANPWGLCRYAVPLDHDGGAQTGCTFLA